MKKYNIDEMVKMRKEGKKYREIGEHFGITTQNVIERLKVEKLKAVCSKNKRKGAVLSESEKNKMIAMRKEGKSYYNIAFSTKRSLSFVRNVLKSINL